MKIKKKSIRSSFLLALGISLFMAGDGEVYATTCDGLRTQALQLQQTYKNDQDYLDEEGEFLARHPVVGEIKANIRELRTQFNRVSTEYTKAKCHPPLGSIEALYRRNN